MKNLMRVRRREEKETHPFSDPTYIRWLTDEYRWARTIRPVPAIYSSVPGQNQQL
jgi:hypothetical protein